MGERMRGGSGGWGRAERGEARRGEARRGAAGQGATIGSLSSDISTPCLGKHCPSLHGSTYTYPTLTTSWKLMSCSNSSSLSFDPLGGVSSQ